MKPAIVTIPIDADNDSTDSTGSLYNSILSILSSKPLLALCFENMEMHVEAATIVDSQNSLKHGFSSGNGF